MEKTTHGGRTHQTRHVEGADKAATPQLDTRKSVFCKSKTPIARQGEKIMEASFGASGVHASSCPG